MALGETTAANEEQKRAALAAMARAGQQGVDAYQQGLAESQAVQRQALDSAARTAAQLNTGGPAHAQLQGIVAQPGNLSQQYLSAGQDRFSRDIARQQSANAGYFDQAAAAVPAIRAQADREVGLMRERWRQQQEKEQADLSKWEIESISTGIAEQQRQQAMAAAEQKRDALINQRKSLDKMEADAQKAAMAPLVKAGPRIMGAQPMRPQPPDQAAVQRLAEIQAQRVALDAEIDRLSGVDSTQEPQVRVPVGPRILGAQPSRLLPPVARSVATLGQTPAESLVAPLHEYQRQAATSALGLPSAQAAGMFQPPTPQQEVARLAAEETLANFGTIGARSPQAALSDLRATDPALVQVATKAGINPQEVPKIRQSNAYRKMRDDAELAVQGAQSIDDLKALLNVTYRKSPKAIRLILAEYGPRLVGSGYVPAGG
jgi:hypothetical protein